MNTPDILLAVKATAKYFIKRFQYLRKYESVPTRIDQDEHCNEIVIYTTYIEK